MNDVTRVLQQIEQGDPLADRSLLPLVYQELRRLAAQKLSREPPGHTLQPTALVHEAYLRLIGPDEKPQWKSRAHFFAAAAETMRRVLVDQARQKKSLKRGGGRERVELEDFPAPLAQPQEDLLALDEALEQLAREAPQKAELVKLRCFAGLTLEQAADLLGIARSTASGQWAFARAWLYRAINRGAVAD
jgi:RNA polymerase sigma factor (TIGR02999 family)